MPEDIKQCLLCLSEKSSLFDQRQFRGYKVENHICADCGLVFQSPRMTLSELDDFYAREYRQLYQGAEGPTQKDLFVQNGRAASLFKILASQAIKPQRYLDIGSSAGILLQRFAERFDCIPVGTEPGKAYRTFAQKSGLTVYADLADLREAREAPFDFVSMAHVLEHLPNPVAYLADLRRDVLTPSGVILIEVPNLYAHDSFEIAHMTSFSAHTLCQVLTKAGFEIIALKKHGRPRSKLLQLYLTVLARPKGEASPREPIQPEKRVPFKRRLGMLWRRVLTKLLPKFAWTKVK